MAKKFRVSFDLDTQIDVQTTYVVARLAAALGTKQFRIKGTYSKLMVEPLLVVVAKPIESIP